MKKSSLSGEEEEKKRKKRKTSPPGLSEGPKWENTWTHSITVGCFGCTLSRNTNQDLQVKEKKIEFNVNLTK